MKLIEAIRQFEAENGRKSTFNDLPQIIQKYAPEKELENSTDAILHTFATIQTEAESDEPYTSNIKASNKYKEIQKELNIDPDDTDFENNIQILKLLVKRHPEILNLNNPNDLRIIELAAEN